jgi:hypothetical protein
MRADRATRAIADDLGRTPDSIRSALQRLRLNADQGLSNSLTAVSTKAENSLVTSIGRTRHRLNGNRLSPGLRSVHRAEIGR